MRRIVPLVLIMILVPLLQAACKPREISPEERIARIKEIHDKLVAEYGPYYPDSRGEGSWPYNYHPILYAAWEFEGTQDLDSRFEGRIGEGFNAYSALRKDLEAQVAEGKTVVETERFLNLIGDETMKGETKRFMDDGILALHAFARAWVGPVLTEFPDAPSQMLVMLGRNFTGRPEILSRDTASDSLSLEWRDWLHIALGACGESGVREVLEFDRGLEDLQQIVPFDDLWAGQMTIALNLRSIQLARAEAIDLLIEDLAPYQAGGKVPGFQTWIYWNLGWTLHDTGGIYPYTGEDWQRVNSFLEDRLLNGPAGEGEEAWVIADALGRLQYRGEAERFLGLIANLDLPCERRKLGYMGLTEIYNAPVLAWETDPSAVEDLRVRSVAALEHGPLDCGNEPLLEFFRGVIFAFSDYTSHDPEAQLTDEELVRVHRAFMEVLPTLVTADERWLGLSTVIMDLFKPEFNEAHPELSGYRDTLLQIHDDWAQSTDFEGAEVKPEDFQMLLDVLASNLGGNSIWVN